MGSIIPYGGINPYRGCWMDAESTVARIQEPKGDIEDSPDGDPLASIAEKLRLVWRIVWTESQPARGTSFARCGITSARRLAADISRGRAATNFLRA